MEWCGGSAAKGLVTGDRQEVTISFWGAVLGWHMLPCVGTMYNVTALNLIGKPCGGKFALIGDIIQRGGGGGGL